MSKKNKKLRDLARGQDCQVRIEGVCNFNPETTVLAHIQLSGGGIMGGKVNDIFGAWCCLNCHNAIDGRLKTDFTYEELKMFAYEGMIRTQMKLIERGVIKC